MEFKTIEQTPAAKKPKPVDESKLGFGRIFTDHFFTMEYHAGQGWHEPTLRPLQPLSLDPRAMCLHYGQALFEGLKAYRGADDSIYLFRPRENARRLNASARRICMPEIQEDIFIEAVRRLVLMEKEWIPRGRGTSLYIRPTMIATEAALGVHPADEYLFFILAGPVGAYYAEGFNPTKIFVSEEYVRAAPGGTGAAKVAGNYAASLMASQIAKAKGYTQVLWLDGAERKYVEEVGTSNIFFVLDDEIITPCLTGSILPGITRDSVIQLARYWNLKITERLITMEEILSAQINGKLREAFASGTAAVISPVGTIHCRNHDHLINEGRVGSLTKRFYEELTGIQDGRCPDPLGWRYQIWP